MNGEKYIMVIAIDKYAEKEFRTLHNAKNDARRLVSVLTSKYGFKTIHDPLFDSKATRRNILETLNELMSSLTKDDSIIIYHAGHGLIHPKTKKGFWIPYEATFTLGDWISHSEIIGYLEEFEVKHLCLITDSCFSGSLFSQSRGVDYATSHYLKLSEFKSRWFLTSGRDERVSDGKAGKGSPFSNALISFFENNTKDLFSISELAMHVEKETSEAAHQTPRSGAISSLGDEGGQLIFELKNSFNDIKQRHKRSWEMNFALFLKARESRSEWPFISKVNPETRELGTWCQDQRVNKRKGTLSREREEKLNNAGFVFDPQIEKFYNGFTKFLVFMHKTGLNDVPARLINHYKSEDAWHRQQQKWYAKAPCNPNNPKAYPEYRYSILLKAGIPLESSDREEAWNQFKVDIVKYYETHSRIITIPSQTDPDKKIASLGKRTNEWMVRWKRNKLSEDRVNFIKQYIDKDYNENKVKRTFKEQIDAYLQFRKEFPNENPPTELRHRPDIKAVIDWKAQVNHRLKKRNLPIHKWKIEQLDTINFPWSKKKRKRIKPQLKLNL